ncbi:MAG TPA: hypothetical protein VFL93_14060 [Longimicrobiaceae bacterium]|nr:hypothetical protein [Longimicrobiaceae bacterium]
MRRYWLLAALPFALTACGGNHADAGAAADTAGTAMDTAAAAPVAAPPAQPPAGMDTTHPTVSLMQLGGSGVTGTATFAAMGADSTQVLVMLKGAPAGVHDGHIHKGRCASPDGVAAPLQPITAGADGTGQMTAVVALPLDSIMDGNHVVAYHEAGGSPGKMVTCGDIPAKM